MPDNNKEKTQNTTNNETHKKHSFFWWEINMKTKDMLDFRYNTQEEIDRLNEEMTITDDLDKIMKQTNNGTNIDENEKDKKETESNLKKNWETFDELNTNDTTNNDEVSAKKSEPIEWEIVEDPEFNEIPDDNDDEKWDNAGKSTNDENYLWDKAKEEITSPDDYDINIPENEPKINEETSENDINEKDENKTNEELTENSTKFFDPFELTFDDEENNNEEKEIHKINNQIFDPFWLNEYDVEDKNEEEIE